MELTLFLQPVHNHSTNIIRRFAHSEPLTSQQANYLEWHQKQLSNATLDPILKYYLQDRHKLHPTHHGIFLLPYEKINLESIQQLKKRIHLFLEDETDDEVDVKKEEDVERPIATKAGDKRKTKNLLKNVDYIETAFTYDQFIEFKITAENVKDLIFWHGNQFLTGAPFFPGGIPPVVFFQWGNLFGIVKHVILKNDKKFENKVLMTFENMRHRDMNQCIVDYNNRLFAQMKLQNKHFSTQVLQNLDEANKTKLPLTKTFLIHSPKIK